MVYTHSYSTSIFDTLGVLSSVNFAGKIWEQYEKYAISKIKDSTFILRGYLYYLKDFSPTQANKELYSIRSIIPVLLDLRRVIENIEDREYRNYKVAAIEFLDTVDFLYSNLQDIADVNSSYKLSQSVLALDWDKEEDEHWNNY